MQCITCGELRLRPTLTPFAQLTVKASSSVQGASSLDSTASNSCAKRINTYSASVSAYC